ncbi:MAG: hypothetical protein AAF915_23925 [Cyanobacteria bacterium P01_D01_bin.50]
MPEFLIAFAIAASIVGGVAAPVGNILHKAYDEERRRLGGGGTPVFPISLVHPEASEVLTEVPNEKRHQEQNR